jgi:hypothetical protein
MMQIIDRKTIGIPGPIGDVTPAAVAARDAAVSARDAALSARDDSRNYRNEAETFAADAEALQDAAMTNIASDPNSDFTKHQRTFVAELIEDTVPPIPPGVITSSTVGRVVTVLDGDQIPPLEEGDLVVRYTLPGNTYTLDFSNESHNAPVTALQKVSGADWIVWNRDPDVPGAENSKVLRINGDGSFYSIPALDADPFKADAEVLVRYRHSGAGQHGPHFYFFGDETFTNGVYVGYTGSSGSTGAAKVRSKVGSAHTDLASVNVPIVTPNQWMMMRARCAGDVLSFKLWPVEDEEPAEWTVSAPITTELLKRAAIGRVSNQGYQYLDWISVATGGKRAVAP